MSNEIKILINRRNKKIGDSNKEFTTFSTKMLLPEITIVDGKRVKSEPVEKWVDVKFAEDCALKPTAVIKGRSYIYAKPENINAPFVYEITKEIKKDDKGNEKEVTKYPTVWIHNSYRVEPAPRHQTQNAFVLDEGESKESVIDDADEDSVDVEEKENSNSEYGKQVEDDLPF